MSKSVSNDALWEKLSEISEQLKCSKQSENAPDLSGVKDEIIAEINTQCRLLGLHNDVNFKANNENITRTEKKIDMVEDIVSQFRKETAVRQTGRDTEQRLAVLETQAKGNRTYFNFRFFKLRKTSVVITILGLLVLTLTVFCMKQQNDYALLLDEFYRQSIISK